MVGPRPYSQTPTSVSGKLTLFLVSSPVTQASSCSTLFTLYFSYSSLFNASLVTEGGEI